MTTEPSSLAHTRFQRVCSCWEQREDWETIRIKKKWDWCAIHPWQIILKSFGSDWSEIARKQCMQYWRTHHIPKLFCLPQSVLSISRWIPHNWHQSVLIWTIWKFLAQAKFCLLKSMRRSLTQLQKALSTNTVIVQSHQGQTEKRIFVGLEKLS